MNKMGKNKIKRANIKQPIGRKNILSVLGPTAFFIFHWFAGFGINFSAGAGV
ncbi:unnamed protein product, partial [marine sediment metagenome]